MDVKTTNAEKPNILIVVMDDMGFSDPGCYGGEIATPNVDKLAANGLRFTNFYNVGRCWPTRSAILTGFYPQQLCMDPPALDMKYRPSWQRTLAHHLKPCGYRSYHSGKWHVFNMHDPVRDGGFDVSGAPWGDTGHAHFAGETKRFSSAVIADHAISCLRQHSAQHSDQPFFQYVAFTAPHFPLQAEEQDIAKYRGRYDEGWDLMRHRRWQRLTEMGIVNCPLSAREADLKAPYFTDDGEDYQGLETEYAVAWDSLPPEKQRFQSTKMSIHAAMVDRTDSEIGRILDQLKAMDAYENTVVFFLSDNGASAELINGMSHRNHHDCAARAGGENSFLFLGPGWSTCCNSPFRRHKIWVHEGGVATPLVVHWPRGIEARGELRHGVGHVIDIGPTLLELAGAGNPVVGRTARAPEWPGHSLVPNFASDGAVQHDSVYFYHEGHRGLRSGRWKIVNRTPQYLDAFCKGRHWIEEHWRLAHDVGQDTWCLYDLDSDRCEMNDLAEAEPRILQDLIAAWHRCDREYRGDSGYDGPFEVRR
jgi:arylsulfatase